MKLEEILPEMRKGRKAQRDCWVRSHYISIQDIESNNRVYVEDIFASDWELETEKPREVLVQIFDDGGVGYAFRLDESIGKLDNSKLVKFREVIDE